MGSKELEPNELEEIERGLTRWHSMSTQTGIKLVSEIRRLQDLLKERSKGDVNVG